MEGGSEPQTGNGALGTLEGGSSSMEARLCKERRRRERRERRARRQHRNSLISQMDGGCIYEQGGIHLPPPAYTTLPGRGRPSTCPQRTMAPPPQHSWRENLPAFARRSRGCGEEGLVQTDGESKTCCGLAVSQTVSIRWFIVMIAFVGICCSVVGTVLGAMKAHDRGGHCSGDSVGHCMASHLTGRSHL